MPALHSSLLDLFSEAAQMKAYRISVNLKLGLIGFAVLIAVASLWYTKDLVDNLKERETAVVQLWAAALEQIPKNQQQTAQDSHSLEFRELEDLVSSWRSVLTGSPLELSQEDYERYRRALTWAQAVPLSNNLNFIGDRFVEGELFGGLPTIVVDSASGQPTIWRSVDVDPDTFLQLGEEERATVTEELLEKVQELARIHDPIPIVVDFPPVDGQPRTRFVQHMYYGESELVEKLRWYPYVQLVFVALFVMVGYFGFSYVRKSEQSSLWVGMAKEAAHQLGTPISSLMGWVEYLRLHDQSPDLSLKSKEETYLEIENDIARLGRVTSRFSDIGSLPKLESQPVGPLLETTTDYMRRRVPDGGTLIRLNVWSEPELSAPLNADLFEWVVENLLKNGLDAMESERGRIDVIATAVEKRIRIDVRDTGKGIERRNWKNVFRPGYSTKKRGWGLGLSLAKRIVEDYHGGTLSLATSRPGHGTTFRIEIPAS